MFIKNKLYAEDFLGYCTDLAEYNDGKGNYKRLVMRVDLLEKTVLYEVKYQGYFIDAGFDTLKEALEVYNRY
jgi:hypothetical protein